jgi:hypothetical protein
LVIKSVGQSNKDEPPFSSLNQILAIMDRNGSRRSRRKLKEEKNKMKYKETDLEKSCSENLFRMNAAQPVFPHERTKPNFHSYKSPNPEVKKISFVIGGIAYENQEDFQCRNPSIPVSPARWPPNHRRLPTRTSSWHPTEEPGLVHRWSLLEKEPLF